MYMVTLASTDAVVAAEVDRVQGDLGRRSSENSSEL